MTPVASFKFDIPNQVFSQVMIEEPLRPFFLSPAEKLDLLSGSLLQDKPLPPLLIWAL